MAQVSSTQHKRWKEPGRHSELFFVRQRHLYELDRTHNVRERKLTRDQLNVCAGALYMLTILQIQLEEKWNRHQLKLRSREAETLRTELFVEEDYEIRRSKVPHTKLPLTM